eukprot:TRINITY_DN19125_c0_g1_i1.p1 TRINITY_DN19125_c0_g1~~TRINITY_DN19125_c0_g1_i1.p1  ORF type:complete len:424 (+),score=153.40 TRINITY_DN19125_c0_g1_i1:106-1272(+)
MAAAAAAAAAPDPEPELRLDEQAKAAIAGRCDASPGQPVSVEVECAICTGPAFKCPVVTTPVGCEHLYHKSCLQDWLRGKAGDSHCCPVCRTVLPPGDAACKVPCREVVNILRAVDVDCPQQCEQPRKRMRYDELETHIAKHCPQTPLACKNDGCRIVVERTKLPDHEKKCQFAYIPCKHCSEKVKAGDILHHVKNECPQRRWNCDRCKKREPITFSERHNHMRQCSGAAKMSDIAELKAQINSMQKSKLDFLAKVNQVLDGPHVSAGTQLKRVLGHLRDFAVVIPTRIRITSVEKEKCTREYTLLPERHNNASVWGYDSWRIFRTPVGQWMVSDDPRDMITNIGYIRIDNGKNSLTPLSTKNWQYFVQGKWTAAPRTAAVDMSEWAQ